MRLIDRPLRPLFPKDYRNDVQIIATALSSDTQNYLDIPAIIGASAALTISDVPFEGPIGACRVGLVDDEFVINPTAEQMEESTLDLRMAGTEDAILMVEAGAKRGPRGGHPPGAQGGARGHAAGDRPAEADAGRGWQAQEPRLPGHHHRRAGSGAHPAPHRQPGGRLGRPADEQAGAGSGARTPWKTRFWAPLPRTRPSTWAMSRRSFARCSRLRRGS